MAHVPVAVAVCGPLRALIPDVLLGLAKLGRHDLAGVAHSTILAEILTRVKRSL